MAYQTKEFMITEEYIKALMKTGKKKLKELTGGAESETLEEEIGLNIDFEEAEGILYKYRRNGIGQAEVNKIMEEGTAYT